MFLNSKRKRLSTINSRFDPYPSNPYPSTLFPFCFELKGAFPSPSEYDTHIVYRVCRDSDVDAVIYTVSGEKVRKLHQQAIMGWNSLYWDTNNNNGKGSASGVFIYSIEIVSGSDKVKKWGKLAIVK